MKAPVRLCAGCREVCIVHQCSKACQPFRRGTCLWYFRQCHFLNPLRWLDSETLFGRRRLVSDRVIIVRRGKGWGGACNSFAFPLTRRPEWRCTEPTGGQRSQRYRLKRNSGGDWEQLFKLFQLYVNYWTSAKILFIANNPCAQSSVQGLQICLRSSIETPFFCKPVLMSSCSSNPSPPNSSRVTPYPEGRSPLSVNSLRPCSNRDSVSSLNGQCPKGTGTASCRILLSIPFNKCQFM